MDYASPAPHMFDSINVDDTFSFSKPPVTTIQLVMYAGASGDYNRIHYDHHFAVEAGLGGVIAHGMLSMGCLSQAVTEWAGAGALVKDIRSRFVSPVKPGDALKFDGVIKAKDNAEGEKTCSVDIDGYVGERRVITGSATVKFANV
ncbi:MaoC/PaaZ C-terminal domain-containing protein [Sneathiella sp.]|uniref:MaoC/PaaZ C-terminal domain-containing protein n=1 Tax=Sneathiella sp. TaxID=1964365 RepID=UPI003563FA91